MATSPTFSPETTERHRAARFAFVPFVARLLSYGPLRGDSKPLPRGEPEALTKETIEAVRELANRGTWRFLSETCGWFKIRGSRLWQQATPPLRFTQESIDLLLAVYNFTRSSSTGSSLDLPECLDANGDLLLDHLVFRRLQRSNLEAGIGAKFDWTAFAKNPLNAASCPHLDSSKTAWARLSAADLSPFLPWIAEDWRRSWRKDSDRRWLSPDSLARHSQTHQALFGHLIQTFETAQRPDLIGFLLNEFQMHEQNSKEDRRQFDSLARGASIGERRRIALPWSEVLELPNELQRIYQSAFTCHPIDRTQPQNDFMAHFHDVEFDNVVEVLGTLRQELRPTLS